MSVIYTLEVSHVALDNKASLDISPYAAICHACRGQNTGWSPKQSRLQWERVKQLIAVVDSN